jgi:hypothetical protein
MLNSELILVLEFFELLLRCFLVVLLILGCGLDTRFESLTDEQNLTKFVIDVLGLDLGPCQTTELFDDPTDN